MGDDAAHHGPLDYLTVDQLDVLVRPSQKVVNGEKALCLHWVGSVVKNNSGVSGDTAVVGNWLAPSAVDELAKAILRINVCDSCQRRAETVVIWPE